MYQGWFLNLERNETRRSALAQHLAGVGATDRYQRFDAVDGRAVAQRYPTQLDPGNLGLWLSHLKLLDSQRQTGVHLHVIEDDTILAGHAVEQFDRLLMHADAQPGGWDLIFTDTLVAADNIELFCLLSHIIEEFQQTGSHVLVDLHSIAFACTSSFFLNRQSIDKYTSLISDQWRLGVPIDLFIRDLVNRSLLKAYLTVPFLTSISATSQQSDIAGDVSRSVAVGNAYRRAFFQDADLEAIDAQLKQLTKGIGAPSPLTMIYLRTLLFRLSDKWTPF